MFYVLFDHFGCNGKVRSLSKRQIEFDNLSDNRVVPAIFFVIVRRAEKDIEECFLFLSPFNYVGDARVD